MFNAEDYWITVVELNSFKKAAGDLLSEDEISGLIAYLAQHPDDGVIIPDTGGIRKLRWRARGRGKRGGARVIYYFRDLNMPLFVLAAYGKGEKLDLTHAEKKAMRAFVDTIVDEHWASNVEKRISGVGE